MLEMVMIMLMVGHGGWEENVSKANILVSEASKLSAGARIFRGP